MRIEGLIAALSVVAVVAMTALAWVLIYMR